MQWARLQVDANVGLRRGAWYRVATLGALHTVVEVRGRPIKVPSALLQIVATPPRRWTVVLRPSSAPRIPTSWGDRYAVCPNCRDRAPLDGEPATMRCKRCNGLFEVAWNEAPVATL